MGQTVAACMIVRDESKSLPGCLKSIRNVVDEIIVVDTGSSDDTKDIAREYDADVYEYEWEGHFGEARNYSFDQANSDWILYIDADERLSPELQKHLDDLINVDGDVLYKIQIEGEILSCTGPADGMIRLWRHGLFRFKEGTSDRASASTQTSTYRGEVKSVPYTIIHCQRENHWLTNPPRILPRIAIDAEHANKNHSSLYYYAATPFAFCKYFAKWFIFKRGYKDGVLGLKFAFMKGLYQALLYLFIGLRPASSDVWKKWQRDDVEDELPD